MRKHANGLDVIPWLSQDARGVLVGHDWPGNVRELENTMARSCALALNNILLPEDIPIGRNPANMGGTLKDALSLILELSEGDEQNALDFVRDELIRHTLEQCNHDLKEASRLLGMTQANLKKRLSAPKNA